MVGSGDSSGESGSSIALPSVSITIWVSARMALKRRSSSTMPADGRGCGLGGIDLAERVGIFSALDFDGFLAGAARFFKERVELVDADVERAIGVFEGGDFFALDDSIGCGEAGEKPADGLSLVVCQGRTEVACQDLRVLEGASRRRA